jgi:hypothetical protein
MRVEQAVFTSARTRRMCGYHLVGRSAGIGDELAGQLSRWSPSHASLLSSGLDATSLSFFPLDRGWVAIARTVYGGPEYSQRGGLQVVTLIFALRRDQLAGYDDNPLVLAHTAYTLGHLRLMAEIVERLPAAEIPDRAPLSAALLQPSIPAQTAVVEELLALVRQQRRVALIGMPEPLAFLAQLLCRMPQPDRLELSFTTGLKPSVDRPFQLHFLPSADAASRRQFASLGMECVSGCEPASNRG